MSYDLIVRGVKHVPLEQIRIAASTAPWLEIDGDERGVLLTNANTGVYVTLTPENGHVVYAINHQRPSFFARELFLLLARFIEAFGWDVYDTQLGLPYSNELFAQAFAAWQRGNAVAPPARDGIPVAKYDAATAWEWNYERPQREADLARQSVSAYVPRIFFVHVPGALHAQTMMLWPEDVRSLLLPQTDFIVYRPARAKAGTLVDRDDLLQAAAYFRVETAAARGIAMLEAPRFSLLRSALDRSGRGPFEGAVIASDILVET